MAIYEMTIKTETAKGVEVDRTTCYGADAVANERNHRRTLAPKGSTQTISVKPLKG